jgi:hypothetical protein
MLFANPKVRSLLDVRIRIRIDLHVVELLLYNLPCTCTQGNILQFKSKENEHPEEESVWWT